MKVLLGIAVFTHALGRQHHDQNRGSVNPTAEPLIASEATDQTKESPESKTQTAADIQENIQIRL